MSDSTVAARTSETISSDPGRRPPVYRHRETIASGSRLRKFVRTRQTLRAGTHRTLSGAPGGADPHGLREGIRE